MKHLLLTVYFLFIATIAYSGPAMWARGGSGYDYPSPGSACQETLEDWKQAWAGYYTVKGSRLVSEGINSFACEIEAKHWGEGSSWTWFKKSTIHTSNIIEYAASSNENRNSGDCEGNPCDVVTGRKTETVNDFSSKYIQFNRLYNSQSIDEGSRLGGYWRHSFETRLDRFSQFSDSATVGTYPTVANKKQSTNYLSEQGACENGWDDIKATYRRGSLQTYAATWEVEQCVVRDLQGVIVAQPLTLPQHSDAGALAPQTSPLKLISMPSGTTYTFKSAGLGTFVETHGEPVSLVEESGVYTFTNINNEEDRFEDGLLVSRKLASGIELTLVRGSYGRITTISDPYGNSINLAYDADNQLLSMTHPNGVIQYSYDVNYNLSTVTYEDNSVLTYHYENPVYPNHLTGYTDQNGVRFATWSYDTEGRAISSEHANGVENVQMQYFSDRTVVTDALGAVRTYHLGSQGGKWVVTDVTGDRCKDCNNNDAKSRDYDANGYMVSKTDWEGNVTQYAYNARGLESTRTEAFGTALARTINTTWHTDFPLPISIVEENRVTTLSYDTDGKRTGKIITDQLDPLLPAQSWSYTYNAQDLMTSVDGPRTDVSDLTSLSYDAQGNLTTVTNALGHTRTYSGYNAKGQPGKIIDENGVETLFSYDARGRLGSTSTQNNSGQSQTNAVTSFTYDAVGQIIQITDAVGTITHYEYGDARRLVAIENGLGERIEYTLDLMGNETQRSIKDVSQQIVYAQSAIYDSLSQLLNTVSPLGHQMQYEYDANGNQTKLIDGLNQEWSNAFDALERLVSQTDPNNLDISYAYDALDRVQSVTDQRGLVTSYTYDVFSNLVARVSPDTGATQFEYDDAGNRTKMTDARGIITNYQYDALNRLLFVSFPANPSENISYSYDDLSNGNFGIGKLTQVIDESGQTNFSYDGRGNLIQKSDTIDAQSYSTSFAYDLADHLTKVTYPSGRQVDYVRDSEGRVQQVTTKEYIVSPDVTVIDNVTYSPFGSMASFTYGNGITRAVTFDQDYRTETIFDQGLAGILSSSYLYDANSNITGLDNLIESQQSQTFAYDTRNHLSSATGNYGQLTYLYDGVGNRTSKTSVLGSNTQSETHSYSLNSNQLTQVDIDDGTNQTLRAFQYNNVGNIVKDTREDGTVFDLLYNNANRYMGMDKNTQPTSAYVFNYAGQRTTKTSTDPTKNEHYHYGLDGALIAVSSESTGDSLTEYVYLNGTKVAMFVNAPQDSDGDSVPDESDAFPLDPSEWLDTDGDSIGDNADTDDDNDLISDIYELANGLNPLLNTDATTDLDDDGLTNLEEFNANTAANNPDTDGDGSQDGVDVFPLNSTEWLDSDGDSFGDNSDNCANMANPNQTDTDADGLGNVCDVEQVTLTSIAAEDGWLRESSENSGIGGKKNTGAKGSKAIRVGDDTKDRQYKSILSFDIATIPNDAQLQNIELRLTRVSGSIGNDPSDLGVINVDLSVGGFNGNQALENADFEAPSSVANTSTVNDGLSASAILTQGGIDSIKAGLNQGTSKVQLRIEHTVDDNDNGLSDLTGYYSSNNSNAARHPKLVIIYVLAD